MIDERELTQLLEQAAVDYVVPEDGPERVLEGATATEVHKRHHWSRTRWLAIACAVVIAVVGATVAIRELGKGGNEATTASRPAGSPAPTTTLGQPISVGQSVGDQGAVPLPPQISGGSEGAAGGAVGGAGGGAAAGPSVHGGTLKNGLAQPSPVPGMPSQAPPPADSAKVIKTGSMQIEVRRGAVGSTMSRLASLANGLGGYVADTRTAEGADDPTGTVTMRVPAATFDDLLARVRSLGDVRSSTTHGQDVTGQYSDVKARLAALNATRSQLLTILQKATAIGDVLAVQDRLNDVQSQVEQLQGQQKMLDDQTAYAALSVDVAQRGAKHGPPGKPSGLAKAWDDARDGFTTGVEDILAASGTALVVLLVLAVVVVVGRYLWLIVHRRLV